MTRTGPGTRRGAANIHLLTSVCGSFRAPMWTLRRDSGSASCLKVKTLVAGTGSADGPTLTEAVSAQTEEQPSPTMSTRTVVSACHLSVFLERLGCSIHCQIYSGVHGTFSQAEFLTWSLSDGQEAV